MKKVFGILRNFFAFIGFVTVLGLVFGLIFIGYGMGFLK